MADLVRVGSVGGSLYAFYDDGQKIALYESIAGNFIPERRVSSSGTNPEPDPTPPPPVQTGEGIQITAQMVTTAITALGGSVGAALMSPQALADSFNTALSKTGFASQVSTKARAAQFVAQSAQETGGYRLIKEQGVSNAEYFPYIGRGWIQVTWYENYLSFGKFLKLHGVITDEMMFVNNPAALENLAYAAYTIVWEFTQARTWWKPNPYGNLFAWCDAPPHANIPCRGKHTCGTPHVVGRCINTGNPYTTFLTNGQTLRVKAYNAVLAVTPSPPSRAAIVSPMKSGDYTLSAYFGQTGSWARYHTGQDFAADSGTPVYAVSDGKILGGMGFSAAGISLVLSFGDSEEVSYWHLSSTAVSAGDTVTAGQKIGEVGNTGNSFGPHLHFEYYPKNGTWRDIYTSTNPRVWLAAKGITI